MTTMTRDQVLETVREARSAGRRANLAYATLRDANLTYADLTGADLAYANLTGAALRDANLTDAILTRTDLAYANLSDANLTDAKLTGVDLTRATLTDAKLTGVDLTDAKVQPGQLLDCFGLRPAWAGHEDLPWDELLPTNPQHRRLVEHLLNDGWNGTLREAIETVEGLAGR